MKLKPVSIISLFVIYLFCSCHHPENTVMIKLTGQTQGTYYAITYFDKDARNFQPEVDSMLNDFDQSVSLWVPNSVISKINNEEGVVEPDEIFKTLFTMSKKVYTQSGGTFDPTVGPLVNAWGFGFTDRQKVDRQMIDSLLLFVGFDKVKMENNKIIKSDPRIKFDFNAIAQGYAVDLIGKFLDEKNISNYLIDIGGEVLAVGKKSNGEFWKVGIEKPADNANYGDDLQAVVNLKDRALATSGNYRKFYEENGTRYSHTIDPASGYPVQHSLLSASVLAVDCASADAFATVFMVMGLEKSKAFLNDHSDLDAYFIFTDENGELSNYFTEGFKSLIIEESTAE